MSEARHDNAITRLPAAAGAMAGAVRLGILTPSSNTVLEPVTVAMTAGLPQVTSHFARFRVTRISLADEHMKQFEFEPIVAAAGLLADAHVNVIGWSGTSGSWLGEENDRELCRLIEQDTGIRATTSVLAMNEVLARTGRRRVALVTPYTADVQQRIIASYGALGIDASVERHLDDPGNFSFARWTEQDVARLIREVAQERPDAIMVMCTNFRGAPLVDTLERELGIPIYDSVSVVVWKALAMSGVAPALVRGWGSLFQQLD